jgi:hypothetical protein
MVFGLDEPANSESVAEMIGQPISDEEMDIRLARLTYDEQQLFLKLCAKLEGRWVEAPAIEEGSVETTATTIEPKVPPKMKPSKS